jgi:hypothetical protein
MQTSKIRQAIGASTFLMVAAGLVWAGGPGGAGPKKWNCGGGCGTATIICDALEAACCCYASGTGTYSCSCMDSDCNGLSNCQLGS